MLTGILLALAFALLALAFYWLRQAYRMIADTNRLLGALAGNVSTLAKLQAGHTDEEILRLVSEAARTRTRLGGANPFDA